MSIQEWYGRHSMELQRAEMHHFPMGLKCKWVKFINELDRQSRGMRMRPFGAVERLTRMYLSRMYSGLPVLDVGCETGKNAARLVRAYENVVLLDVAWNALEITLRGLDRNFVVDTIEGTIENLDVKWGPFKAVVGTFTFSFIHPEIFHEVMEENVFKRIQNGGYFAGGFFGPKHCFASNRTFTILTRNQIEELFSLNGFTVREIVEVSKEMPTIFLGNQMSHHFEVIAQKTNP